MDLEKIILDFFDFLGNIDFNMFGTLLVVALVVFWLVVIGWVWIDSSERTSKRGLKIGYILLVIFFNIFDGTGTIQGLLKKDEIENEKLELFSEVIDIGDFLEVRGSLFTTKRGEITKKIFGYFG